MYDPDSGLGGLRNQARRTPPFVVNRRPNVPVFTDLIFTFLVSVGIVIGMYLWLPR